MNDRRSAKPRRRQHAAAVVCALSLFVALIVGSALRPDYNTAVLPVASTHVTHHHNVTGARYVINSPRSTQGSRKPFRNVWMTHDLPSDSGPASSHQDWFQLPGTFLVAEYRPPGAQRASPTTTSADRNILNLFCINLC